MFCNSNLNLLGNTEKGLFKKLLTNKVPKEILWRKKEGFNAPIHNWMAQYPKFIDKELFKDLSPLLMEILKPSVIRKWMNNKKLRTQAGATLYALFVLNRWLRYQDVT